MLTYMKYIILCTTLAAILHADGCLQVIIHKRLLVPIHRHVATLLVC
jgi:hypothetical protein